MRDKNDRTKREGKRREMKLELAERGRDYREGREWE